jgi:hypothetical protein
VKIGGVERRGLVDLPGEIPLAHVSPWIIMSRLSSADFMIHLYCLSRSKSSIRTDLELLSQHNSDADPDTKVSYSSSARATSQRQASPSANFGCRCSSSGNVTLLPSKPLYSLARACGCSTILCSWVNPKLVQVEEHVDVGPEEYSVVRFLDLRFAIGDDVRGLKDPLNFAALGDSALVFVVPEQSLAKVPLPRPTELLTGVLDELVPRLQEGRSARNCESWGRGRGGL